jgi:MFS family permease
MNESTLVAPVAGASPHESQRSLTNFWKLWTANSFSNLGDGLYQVSLPLLAVTLTTSPILISGLGVMLGLPWLLFALQAGSIVDRFDRRQVMLAVSGARILVLGLLTAAILAGSASLWLVYLAALLLGIGETLADTALTAIVPSVVSKDGLAWANSRITASQTVTNIFIGPPLAGFLVGLGVALATGSSILLYLLAAAALLLVRRGSYAAGLEHGPRQPGGWAHITGGLKFLWANTVIRKLTLFTAAMNLFWGGWAALLVLFVVAPGPMGLGDFEYGLLLSAMAIGGLFGSLLSQRVQRAVGTRNALLLDLLGTVALVGVPALTAAPWAVTVSLFAAGFGASIWVILVATIRQQLVPDELLGRVYSASRFLSWGIGPIGAALAGLVAEFWGIRSMFAIGAVLSLGLVLLFLRTVPAALLEQE